MVFFLTFETFFSSPNNVNFRSRNYRGNDVSRGFPYHCLTGTVDCKESLKEKCQVIFVPDSTNSRKKVDTTEKMCDPHNFILHDFRELWKTDAAGCVGRRAPGAGRRAPGAGRRAPGAGLLAASLICGYSH